MPQDPSDAEFEREAQRIGRCIRAAREQHNLSQERVFLAVPMNRSHYQDVEAGRANPTLRTLWHIARAIGVPLRDLMG